MTLALGNGDYGWFSTFVGITLTLLVLAFHRPASATTSPLSESKPSHEDQKRRRWLIRLAFGFTLTLCLYVTLAWALQYVNVDPWLELSILVVVAIILACVERAMGDFLDAEAHASSHPA